MVGNQTTKIYNSSSSATPSQKIRMVISWEPREVSEIRWFQNDRKGLPEAYPAITFPKLWQYFMKVEETQNVGYISEKIKEWEPKKKIRHACSSHY